MLAMSDHDRHGREPGGAAMLLIVGPPTWLAAAMFAVALCRAASHGDRTSAERARLASILNSLGSAPSLPGPSRKTPRQPRSLVRCGRGGISPDVPAPLNYLGALPPTARPPADGWASARRLPR